MGNVTANDAGKAQGYKWGYFAIVVILLIATFAVILFLFPLRKSGPEPGIQAGEVPEQRSRINTELAKLQRESYTESVRALTSEDGQYQYTGTGWGNGAVLEADLGFILGNRRIIKVLDHIEGLEPSQRSEACREFFQAMLAERSRITLMSLRAIKNPKYEQKYSAELSRRGLFTAMMATARSGNRKLLVQQFRQMETYLEGYEFLLQAFSPTMPEAARKRQVEAVRRTSISDRRGVLNLLLMVSEADKGIPPNAAEEVRRLCEQFKIREEVIPIVPWYARTTWFESSLVANRVDETKGVVNWVLYDWDQSMYIDNSSTPEKDKFIEKLRKLILPQADTR